MPSPLVDDDVEEDPVEENTAKPGQEPEPGPRTPSSSSSEKKDEAKELNDPNRTVNSFLKHASVIQDLVDSEIEGIAAKPEQSEYKQV